MRRSHVCLASITSLKSLSVTKNDIKHIYYLDWRFLEDKVGTEIFAESPPKVYGVVPVGWEYKNTTT